MKVSKGNKKNKRELHHLASKWKIDISDLRNTWAIKMNVECSRREYLALKAQQEAYRRKYLESTGRLVKWKKEKKKREFKWCNNTFRKKKLKAIKRVEYRENGVLI